MKKYYCDKCKKEIRGEKRYIAVNDQNSIHTSFDLCDECYKKLGIRDALRDGFYNREIAEGENSPGERLYDAIAEIVMEMLPDNR